MFNGYALFKIYHSLHLHFTSPYDFIKYGDRSKAVAFNLYEKRKDKLRFENFANKLTDVKHATKFCIANFVHNEDHWIYEDFATADLIHRECCMYFDRFDYNFKKEYGLLEGILNEKHTTFKTILQPTASWNQPALLQLLLHRRLSPEFIGRLDMHFDFISRWLDMYKNVDPFVERKLLTLKKYEPLFDLMRK